MINLLFIHFQSPLHLWGLFLVLIPILIHLFSFRNFKKVVISDVTLLKDIKNSGVARKNLKELLVLVFRALAIAFLVIAFSEPVAKVNGNDKGVGSLVQIHIDNSNSMGFHGNQDELLRRAKSVAESIVNLYGVNDRFQIQSNDFNSSTEMSWQKKKAKNKLAEIGLSPTVRSLESVLARMNEFHIADKNLAVKRYVVSDFDYSIDTVSLVEENESITFVSIRAKRESNIYVDSVWFSSNERKIQGFDTLHFAIVNTSEKDLNSFSVNMTVNGNAQFVTVDLLANARTTGEFVYKVPTGSQIEGLVSIESAALPFDNEMYFAYVIPEKIKMLVVSSNTQFIGVVDNLFASDSNIVYTVVSDKQIDYQMVKDYDLFLLGELDYISTSLKSWLIEIYGIEGKKIIIVPSASIDINSYNALNVDLDGFVFSPIDTTVIELSVVDQNNVFFDQVFKVQKTQSNIKVKMPLLKKHYDIAHSKGTVVLSKSNQKAYLSRSEKMTLFSSAVTDEGSDFSKHPLVVPVFIKLVYSSVSSSELYATYGLDKQVRKGVGEHEYLEIKSPDSIIFSSQVIAEGGALLLDENFKTAGLYEVLVEDSLVEYVAINQSRKESSADESMFEALRSVAARTSSITLLEDVGIENTQIHEDLTGKTYWKLFLILSGVCLVVEMLVLRGILRRTKLAVKSPVRI